MVKVVPYNDEYETCADTYATLRIYPELYSPAQVTELLGISGAKEVAASSTVKKSVRPAAWFFSSKGVVTSKDSRRHIDWLLDHLKNKKEAVQELHQTSVIDISCYWLSASGHGGPTISPHQMQRLSELNIEVFWDIYLMESAGV